MKNVTSSSRSTLRFLAWVSALFQLIFPSAPLFASSNVEPKIYRYADGEVTIVAERTARVQAAMDAMKLRNEARLRTQVAQLAAKAASSRRYPTATSLLDRDFSCNKQVHLSDVELYRSELHSLAQDRYRAAQLHIWIGEYLLTRQDQPHAAERHFLKAKSLVDHSSSAYGLACFDYAIALDFEGAYVDTVKVARNLIGRPDLCGYSIRMCKKLLRSALGGAGYHAERSSIGIPEPPRLDPYCGVASVATCLRNLGLPWDIKSVSRICRMTGVGSSSADVVAAFRRSGLSTYVVNADERGLINLPKPLVAFVEHDHFVGVTKVDSLGVTYLCSDCGRWPGGVVKLTWPQWRRLDASPYIVAVRKGALDDQRMTATLLPSDLPRYERSDVHTVAFDPRGSTRHLLPLWSSNIITKARKEKLVIRGRVIRFQSTQAFCGGSAGLKRYGGDPPALAAPSPDGDPVNLVTGEEAYAPEPDMTVYNANGPSVSWSRLYNSDREPGEEYGRFGWTTYEDNDFGEAWSQSYNIGVVEGSQGQAKLFYPDGASVNVAMPLSGNSGSCTIDADSNIRVYWTNDGVFPPGFDGGYFTITLPNGTRLITNDYTPSAYGMLHTLKQIVDRNGNAIDFNYGSPASGCDWPLLSSIEDHATSTTLLTINRATDGTGNIISVTDNVNSRTVYYTEETILNTGVPPGSLPQSYQELDTASEIVPTGTTSPPTKQLYGYTLVTANASSAVPFLATDTTPSPTGSGLSTFTFNYSSTTDQVTSTVDGNGNQRIYSTPANGLNNKTTVTVKDPGNNTVYSYTVTYDTNSVCETARTDGAGNTIETLAYTDTNSPERPTSFTDGNGNEWLYSYNADGNITSESSPRGRTFSGGAIVWPGTTTNYSYDSTFPLQLSSVTRQTDPTLPPYAANPTVLASYGYDANGNLHTLSSPLPGDTTAGASNPLVTTTMTYDTLGNITSLVYPRNETGARLTTIYNYTSDPAYGYTHSEQLGLPLTISGSLSDTVHFRYDSRGNIISVIDPRGNETDTTYALGDQPLVTKLPATGQTGKARSYVETNYAYRDAYGSGPFQYVVFGPVLSVAAYDERNNATPVYPPDNGPPFPPVRESVYTFDQEERPLTVSAYNPGNATTYTLSTTAYDANDRVTSIEDASGHATSYAYNSQGYLSSISYPGVSSAYDHIGYTSYDYDGNALTRIDGRNRTTTYSYSDPESKLTGISYPSPAIGTAMTYDSIGRLASMNDAAAPSSPSGTFYTYDNRDVPTRKDVALPGLPRQALQYLYNPDGSRHFLNYGLSINGGFVRQGQFVYGHDADGRLTKLIDPAGETTSWQYRPDGSITSQTLGDGIVTTTSVNALDQITAEVNAVIQSGKSVPRSTYSELSHDGVGNLVGINAAIPAGSTLSASSGVTTYAYDYQGRLTLEKSTRPALKPAGATNSQVYDTIGNLVTLRSALENNSYNSDNQPTSFTFPNGVSSSGFAYDGNGNPTTYKGDTVLYDDENRITSYSHAGTVLMSAVSNGFGQRASKTSGAPTPTNSNRTYFIYDRDGAAVPLLELNGTGSITAINTVGVCGLVSRTTGTGSVFYTFDPQGNVSQTFDKTGQVVSQYMFDAFGNRIGSGSGNDPYAGFCGQWGYRLDSESKLSLLDQRYYDPTTGRFITRDPIGYGGGLDLYSYVRNNPINNVDPTGLLLVTIGGAFYSGLGPWGMTGGVGVVFELPSLGSDSFGIGLYKTGGFYTGLGLGVGIDGGVGVGAGNLNGFYGPSSSKYVFGGKGVGLAGQVDYNAGSAIIQGLRGYDAGGGVYSGQTNTTGPHYSWPIPGLSPGVRQGLMWPYGNGGPLSNPNLSRPQYPWWIPGCSDPFHLAPQLLGVPNNSPHRSK